MNESHTRAPHRRSESPGAESPHAALLIDFDNVTMGIRSDLGQEIRKLLDSDIIRGKVSVQRAYADWRRYPQYIVPLSEASVDLIFAPAYGSSKKNATDIRLAIDALEIVFTRPEIGTFILLSGDSDFSSLVLKLKEYGKYVIGVGIQESSSDLLVQNCDEYYSYSSLSGMRSAADMPTERFDPWELAERAIGKMVDRKDVMRSDRFKQVMLELDPSFNERSLGFSKFNRFLTEAASRGIIQLQKAANGQYEVAPGTTAARPPAAVQEESSASPGRGSTRDRARERAGSGAGRAGRAARAGSGGRSRRPRADDGAERTSRREEPPPRVDEGRLRAAYDLLRRVVGSLASRSDGSVRDSEVKRRMLEGDERFDEGTLGFRKFSSFLRQAHDEEVIDLVRDPAGHYLISPAAGAGETGPSAGPGKKGRARTGSEREERRGGSRARRSRAQTPPDAAEAAESVGGGPGAEAPTAEAEGASAGEPAGATERVTPGAEKTASADVPPATAPRRTLGRYRRGSRGRSGPAARGTGLSPAPSETAAGRDATPAGPTPAADDLVDRMSRTYPGVGRRTAERLVQEFGDRLLEVIDTHPERLSSVLPEHRARAVIEGRKAEKAAAGGA
ncbi:MAG: NYN domain-containing protein [Gemmatimonadota bacterium]